MEKRGNKKAQVTIFVILGLVIVILSVLGYYYRTDIIENLRERGILETAVLPLEVRGVSNLVDSCLEEITKAGVEILGQQGGYILMPEPKLVTPVNPFSNALEVFPGSSIRVAYWLVQSANGLLESLMPTRQKMEQELENYVNANLDNCVDFSNLDFNILSGDVKSDVRILNKEVRVNVEYPLEIDFQGKKFRLRDFSQNIKLPLGELYEKSIEIINKENQDFFLEERTIDYMNVYDEIPYSGVDFECSPRRWKKDEVINELKNILDVNIDTFRVKDTKDSEVEDKYRLLNILEEAQDINVDFEYSPSWPLLIDIIPEGNILQGESFNKGPFGRFLTQFFCLNSYNFVYDLKYPILVSLAKEDYVFQFATQVIIDNNQPRENKIEIDQSYDTNPIICQNPLTKIKVFALGINPDNSLEPLENAKISYKCSTTTCDIGETKNIDNEIFLEEKFPQCINGQLIVEKDGYDKAEVELSTNKETTVSVLIEPIYELPFEIKINENGVIRNTLSNEQVIITFRDENANYFETIIFPDSKTVKLIDGSYNVEALVMFNSQIYIEGQELETCLDKPREGILGALGLTKKECIKTKVEGVTLPQVLSGGANFRLNINREDLANAKKIIFYVNGFGIPSNVNELNNVYNKINSVEVINPEFVK